MTKRKMIIEIFQGVVSLLILSVVLLNYFSIWTPASLFKSSSDFVDNNNAQNFNVQLTNESNNSSVNNVDNHALQSDNYQFTEDAYRYPINYDLLSRYNKSQNKQQFVLTTEKTIILRMDDVQGYAWNDIFINLTDAILYKNMSVSLGVIPDRPNREISEDTIAKNYLLSEVKNPNVEIVQHGLSHAKSEFLNLNESSAYNLTKIGLTKIISVLNVYPVTFAPPENQYNENTTKVLSKLGFRIISADQGEYKYDNGIIFIGYTITTKHSNVNDLVPASEIIDSCKKSLDAKNICVILIHPQDYANKDLKSLNQTRYNEFNNMLDGLDKLNVKFSTFAGLIK